MIIQWGVIRAVSGLWACAALSLYRSVCVCVFVLSSHIVALFTAVCVCVWVGGCECVRAHARERFNIFPQH